MVFLYLKEEEASLLILIPAGIAAVIEVLRQFAKLMIEGNLITSLCYLN